MKVQQPETDMLQKKTTPQRTLPGAKKDLARARRLISLGRIKKAAGLLQGLTNDCVIGREATLLLSMIQDIQPPNAVSKIERKIISSAREFYEKNDPFSAYILLSQIQWSATDAAELNMLLGAVCLGVEAYDEALRAFRMVLKQEPDSSAALSNIAICHWQMKHVAATKQALEQSLAFEPSHPQSLNLLAELHKRSNEIDEAMECYDKAIKAHPNFYDANFNKACLLETTKSPTHALRFISKLSNGLQSQDRKSVV